MSKSCYPRRMIRDGASLGRGAGSLLVEVLLQLATGTAVTGPRGASRVGRELRLLAFATHAEAGVWMQAPDLVDAVVIDVLDNEVRVLVPAEGGGPSFDLVWTVRYAVDENSIATSEPAFTVADGMDDLLDEFNDGMAAGLERHPRTVELREGFGALGPFVGPGDQRG